MHCRRLGSLFTLTLLVLSLVSYTHLLSAPAAYAHDHKANSEGNSKKIKNQSLIAGISDQVVNPSNNKDALQQVLQQIQNHIVQTSGQDKATKVLDQIKSLIELNPSGNLAQSLLSLAKQQSSGNTNAVNQSRRTNSKTRH